MADYKTELDELIKIVFQEDASDLHLSEGKNRRSAFQGFYFRL